VKANTLTVVGFSSGSWMAHQMHVAFSETIRGAGLIEGGPYLSGYKVPNEQNVLRNYIL